MFALDAQSRTQLAREHQAGLRRHFKSHSIAEPPSSSKRDAEPRSVLGAFFRRRRAPRAAVWGS